MNATLNRTIKRKIGKNKLGGKIYDKFMED